MAVLGTNDGANLGSIDDTRLEVTTGKSYATSENGVDDKVAVRAELGGGESAERVKKERSGGSVGANGEEMETLVGF